MIIKFHSRTDLKYLLNRQDKFVLTECLCQDTFVRQRSMGWHKDYLSLGTFR